ncbi:MAG TPA: membrane dipeptidase [Kofleriaceae bacterium]|nr:membrane dipeptidase [Kofleriaceae bacterium]
MMYRQHRRIPLLALLFVPVIAHADDLAARAKKLQAEAIVVDTHLDAPDQLASKWADVASRGATDHFDIPRAKEGGLTAPFFSIYVAASYADNGAARRALELIDLTHRVVDGHPRDMMMASSVADIRAAKQAGKLGILMGIEGGHAIEDSLAVLREMYRAGVRYMTLTHTNTNHWADSSGPFYEPDFDPRRSAVHGGLSEFGKDVVKEMNRLGMIVDISHVSDATIRDVLAVSRAPVMASHSSCRAISNMPRNLTDDQIKQIAAKGGVVMINVGSGFLDQGVYDQFQAMLAKVKPEYLKLKARYAKDPARLRTEMMALYKKQERPGRASWTKVVDHIEHVMTVGGEDAVGIGADFDGIEDPPVGFEDVSLYPKISEELLRRGHSEAQVKKVLGENFLAFFARVEAVKARLASEPPATTVYKAR